MKTFPHNPQNALGRWQAGLPATQRKMLAQVLIDSSVKTNQLINFKMAIVKPTGLLVLVLETMNTLQHTYGICFGPTGQAIIPDAPPVPVEAAPDDLVCFV